MFSINSLYQKRFREFFFFQKSKSQKLCFEEQKILEGNLKKKDFWKTTPTL